MMVVAEAHKEGNLKQINRKKKRKKKENFTRGLVQIIQILKCSNTKDVALGLNFGILFLTVFRIRLTLSIPVATLLIDKNCRSWYWRILNTSYIIVDTSLMIMMQIKIPQWIGHLKNLIFGSSLNFIHKIHTL